MAKQLSNHKLIEHLKTIKYQIDIVPEGASSTLPGKGIIYQGLVDYHQDPKIFHRNIHGVSYQVMSDIDENDWPGYDDHYIDTINHQTKHVLVIFYSDPVWYEGEWEESNDDDDNDV